MSLRQNIIKLYMLKSVTWFMVAMPVIILFFQENNFSLTEIMFLQALYSFSLALFEIPSGYIADIFGRKKSIVISTILSFSGYLLFCFYDSFQTFCIAEILIGIGASMISGSDSALLYDTLIETKSKKNYTKIEGRNYAIGNFSEATAAILGGFLAVSSIYLPIYVQTIVLSLSIPISLSLVEPKINTKNKLERSFKTIIQIISYTIIDNKKLKWLVIYSSAMGVATLSIAWFAQPFFKLINIPLVYFGILWAVLNFSAGLTSFNAHLIYKKNNIYNTLIFLAISMSILFIIIALQQTLLAILFILFIYLIRGVVTPILRNEINLNTESRQRATVLSVRSFIIRISFAIFAPILGFLADNFSLSISFLTIGILTGLFSILSAYKLFKLNENYKFTK